MNDPKKNATVTVRLPPEQKEAIERKVGKRRISKYIRDAVERDLNDKM